MEIEPKDSVPSQSVKMWGTCGVFYQGSLCGSPVVTVTVTTVHSIKLLDTKVVNPRLYSFGFM